MSEYETILGIDLGTTNSAVGVLRDGIPQLIEIDGNPTMPSCVGIGEGGEILVGQAAMNQLAAAPERTVASVKRQMGSEIPIELGDKSYRPEEISAFILKRLKEEAERDLGQEVTKAVVTVPAYFDERQRRATQDAAKLAGLEAVRILNEPTAAALAYNVRNEERQSILVYDLGGGTFDVSLVLCEKGLVEVKASHGDTHLGGDDFDDLLTTHLAKAWTGKTPLDLTDPRTGRRLKLAAEAAKRRLSDHAFAAVREEFLTDDSHLDIELERTTLEELIEPLLTKTWDAIHAALRDGAVQPRDVDKVLLVGGSTRIPLVRHLIENCLGRPPSAEVNPDLVVALGAAIQGGLIAGQEAGSILVDIATHSFSVSALDAWQEVCVPLIPRGSALPATRSEAFETGVDSQKMVEVRVFQGESRQPEENLEIGTFLVEGLSKVPAGNVILCQFSLDLNGLLEVTAVEKATGLSKSVTIDIKDVEASFDLAEARQRVAEAFGESGTIEREALASEAAGSGEHDQEMIRAKELKKRANKLLEGEVDDEDRADIEKLVRDSREAVKAGDVQTLRDCSDRLEDILFYLED